MRDKTLFHSNSKPTVRCKLHRHWKDAGGALAPSDAGDAVRGAPNDAGGTVEAPNDAGDAVEAPNDVEDAVEAPNDAGATGRGAQ